ncbi:hypothetical protein C8A05DRAFT_34313 [Staphylotrichum tortipilum]|uniref:Uncharacterized protein n=1 Tax=Staphylotrichum tortipilum TaxID=2831512 RepID=A0AAN6MJC8_9PEZI|nr:hypothetical protein C8A05DRAFT_34313 [Staphylotrichum longicolle]
MPPVAHKKRSAAQRAAFQKRATALHARKAAQKGAGSAPSPKLPPPAPPKKNPPRDKSDPPKKDEKEEEEYEVGAERAQACVGCLRSALRGKSPGRCHDAVTKGSRCARCARGKKCVPIPVVALTAANRFLVVRQGREQLPAKVSFDALRTCVRVLLALAGEDPDADDDDDDSVTGMPTRKKQKKEEKKKEKGPVEEEEESSDDDLAPGIDPHAFAAVAAALSAFLTPQKRRKGSK